MVQLTPDEMFTRLLQDDELYCARNLKIRDKYGKITPFIWNTAQRMLHTKIEAQLAQTGYVRALVLKGRQQGCSTWVGARFYKKTSTQVGKRCMILTHLDAATDNLFGMAKTYWELSDEVFRPSIKANNGSELSFKKLRSGYKVATAGSKHAGRSDTIQFLHGSEAAFWPNAKAIMGGLGQTVPLLPGSEMIIETTANGLNNLFRQMWILASQGKGDFIPIFIPWFVQEEYQRPVPPGFELSDYDAEYMDTFELTLEQMAWRRAKIDTELAGDVDWFNQEYPATPDLAFLKVGHRALINTLAVKRARNGNIEHRERIGAHVVGVDPARFGDDSTAFIHRQGRVAWSLKRIDGYDTMQVTGECVLLLSSDKTIRRMFIDIGGLGAGVYDRLVELGYGDRVTAVNFGSKARDDRKYKNKRSEMWGEMADWIHDDITPLIPDDDVLHGDLTAPSYSHSSNGQIQLDPKDKIKKETGKSPDCGDALALTFAEPVAADDQHVPNWRRDRLLARNKSAMRG